MKLNLSYWHRNDCFRVLFRNVWMREKIHLRHSHSCKDLIWAASLISEKLSKKKNLPDPIARTGHKPQQAMNRPVHSISVKVPMPGKKAFEGRLAFWGNRVFMELLSIHGIIWNHSSWCGYLTDVKEFYHLASAKCLTSSKMMSELCTPLWLFVLLGGEAFSSECCLLVRPALLFFIFCHK